MRKFWRAWCGEFGARLLAISATLPLLSSPAHAEIFFVHNDHRGAPVAMTDKTGAVIWNAKYDPFGKATITKTPSVATPNPPDLNLRFPGQYFDAETVLHYNYFRDYDPATGRYLQPDPIGLAGGPNPYVYANNNPLRFTDPLGLGPLAFGTCTAINAGNSLWGLNKTRRDLVSDTELLRDQLRRVDEEIEHCPLENTDRFAELGKIRESLTKGLLDAAKRAAQSNNSLSSSGFGQALMLEGVCGLLMHPALP